MRLLDWLDVLVEGEDLDDVCCMDCERPDPADDDATPGTTQFDPDAASSG